MPMTESILDGSSRIGRVCRMAVTNGVDIMLTVVINNSYLPANLWVKVAWHVVPSKGQEKRGLVTVLEVRDIAPAVTYQTWITENGSIMFELWGQVVDGPYWGVFVSPLSDPQVLHVAYGLTLGDIDAIVKGVSEEAEQFLPGPDDGKTELVPGVHLVIEEMQGTRVLCKIIE